MHKVPSFINAYDVGSHAVYPLASNVATAELLIKSLEHGDLEWREAYNA